MKVGELISLLESTPRELEVFTYLDNSEDGGKTFQVASMLVGDFPYCKGDPPTYGMDEDVRIVVISG